MKKSLLLLCGAMAAVSASATSGVQPQVVDNLMVCAVSADGSWMVAKDGYGAMKIFDNVTGKTYLYVADEENPTAYYETGNGNCVSNTGVVVGCQTESGFDASYWKDGKWNYLPLGESDTGMNGAQGISADGKRICGYYGGVEMGLDETQIMILPAVWELGEDGEYGMYTALPYPEKDFSGRTPEYITAVSISEDGKTIAGQVVDYTGMYPQPIIYQQDEEGNWSYKLLYSAIFQNNDLTWGTDPGEAPEAPNPDDYMTEAQIQDYNDAVDAYNEYYAKRPSIYDYATDEEISKWEDAKAEFDWQSGDPYPQIEDFMTEEELAKYNAAVDEFDANAPDYPVKRDYMDDEERTAYDSAMEKYDEEMNKWWELYDAYDKQFYENVADFPTFSYNNVLLSNNGKYYGTTSQMFDWWTYESLDIPYLLDLETDLFEEYDFSGLVICVADDGAVLAATPANSYYRYAYISTGAGEPFEPLQDYIKAKNEDLYGWMEKNMVHSILDYAENEETGDWEEVVVPNVWTTGTAIATPNLDMFMTWVGNNFADESEEYFYSYILPMDYSAGISKVALDKNLIVKVNDGVINITGEASKVEVYDVYGRKVYSVNNPGSCVSTGLQNGMYLVKATGAEGNATIVKAAF